MYLNIVQIDLFIRDSNIQNILFCSGNLEAVEQCKTYKSCMLKTSDFLNKILLTGKIKKKKSIFTREKTQP